MRPSLGAGPCAYMLLDLLPVLSVKPHSLDEQIMLLLRPPPAIRLLTKVSTSSLTFSLSSMQAESKPVCSSFVSKDLSCLICLNCSLVDWKKQSALGSHCQRPHFFSLASLVLRTDCCLLRSPAENLGTPFRCEFESDWTLIC